MRSILLFAVIALTLNGCAGVSARKVASEDQEGFRYFLPRPYLLVTYADAKTATPDQTSATQTQASGPAAGAKAKPKPSGAQSGTPPSPGQTSGPAAPALQYKIIYLPNLDEKYAVRINSGLGSVNTNLKITDGWQLTEVGGNVDTKIPETLNAISGLVKAALPAGVPSLLMTAKAPEMEKKELEPGLYSLTFTNGVVTKIHRIRIDP